MVLPFEKITQSKEATQRLGEEVGRANVSNIICLWGELGSGKTTFVQGLARSFGITSRLLSPTFIIVRRYSIPKKEKYFYHLDLYRMTGKEDALSLGFTEMIAESESFVVIEWPERLEEMLPKHRLDIRFTVLPNGDHKIVANKI